VLHLTFLPLLSGVPYIENINICLNVQRFIGAIAKNIAMALKGSLGGRCTLPTANFAIPLCSSLSDTRTSLTGTLCSQISHQMCSGACSTHSCRPPRLQMALYPSVHANQQIWVPAMTGVLLSVHLFMSRYNDPNHSCYH
jgi:hypothetical protein